MDDQNNPSPSPAVGRRFQRDAAAEEVDGVACTGKSCQSCTAGAIADCVAVCCCPCAVVNILVLAFFKLPYAVARKCLRGRRRRDGISEMGRAEEGKLGIGEEEVLSVSVTTFSAEEACEVGHLGFGRVSFTGINFHTKGS